MGCCGGKKQRNSQKQDVKPGTDTIEKTEQEILSQLQMKKEEEILRRKGALMIDLKGKRWPKGNMIISGDFNGKLESLEPLPGTHHQLGWSTNPTTGFYNYLFLLRKEAAEKYLTLLMKNPKKRIMIKQIQCSIFKHIYKDHMTAAFILSQEDNNPYILNTGKDDLLWFRLKPYFRFLITGENPYRSFLPREEIDMCMKHGKIPNFLSPAIERQYNERLNNRPFAL